MNARAAVPWLLSLAVHAGVLLVPIGFLLTPGPVRPAPSIELTFATPRAGTRAAPVSPGPAQFEGQAASAGPALSFRAPPSTNPAAPTGPSFVTSGTQAGVSSIMSDVQPDVAGTREQSAPASSAPAGEAVQAGPGPGTGSTGGTGSAADSGATIGWAGTPRVLLRSPEPRFPRILSASGQEVEGEARITVAPSGAVVRVEITRSTGYIEVDASVEAALRDYLFSRVDGRGDALGTVRFRFRLEKID